jgi:hypothetical protein
MTGLPVARLDAEGVPLDVGSRVRQARPERLGTVTDLAGCGRTACAPDCVEVRWDPNADDAGRPEWWRRRFSPASRLLAVEEVRP